MRHWPAKNWVVFLISIVMLFGIIGYLVYCYVKAHVGYAYLGAFILVNAIIFLPAILCKKTHVLHLHHYNVG